MAERELAIVIRAKDLASKAIKGVNQQLGSIGSHAQKGLKNAAHNIGRGIQVAGAAAVGGLTYAVKLAADFDDAMTQSLAIMSDVTPQLRQQMESTAREVARTTTFSASEAAEAYFFLASAGLSAEAQLKAMPQVAKFAQAGMFDMALATDLLTDAQSALGMTVRDDAVKNLENMTRVSDTLVKANQLSNATVQQFSESLTNRAGAALKLVNKDVEEGVAVLAAWADQGVKGAEAGTRLDIVLRDLQRRGIQNADEMEKYGVRVFDASGNVRNMADIVEDLENAMEGLSDEQKRAAIMEMGFADRSVAALMSLLGTSDAIRQYEADLRSAGGATDEVANKQLESFSAKLKLLKSNLEDAGITIGQALIPALSDLASEFTEWLQRDEVKAGIKQFAEDAANGLRDLVGWAKSLDWESIGNSLKTAASFAKGLVDAFLSMPSWVQQAVVTGWGLNKLTGGAVGAIVGELGKGLIRGVLGINAGVVNVNAATVNGGVGAAGPAAAGGRGLLGTAAKFVLGPAAAIALGKEIAQGINDPIIQPAKDRQGAAVRAVLDSGDSQKIVGAIGAINDQLNSSNIGTQIALIGSRIPYIGDALGNVAPTLERQREELKAELQRIWETEERGVAAARDALPWHERNLAELHNLNMSEAQRGAAKEAADAQRAAAQLQKQSDALAAVRAVDSSVKVKGDAQVAKQAEALAAVRATHGPLHTIAAKNFSPSVFVNTTVNSFLSINEWQRTVQSAQRTYSTNSGGI